MQRLKAAAAAAVAVLVLSAAPPGFAQVGYIPPGVEGPRFGGQFLLSEPGPVNNYWPTMCRDWRSRSRARRGGPAATPPVLANIQGFVSGLISKDPNFDALTPAMAESVRKNLSTYWPSFNRMGRATVANQFANDKAGNGLFVVNQRGGRTHWNMTITPDGKIDRAFLCEGQGL